VKTAIAAQAMAKLKGRGIMIQIISSSIKE
jgi:hypothetical protein